MVVRIRLGRESKVRRRGRRNQRLALAGAALLQPLVAMAGALGIWRLGADLGVFRPFAISAGLFSHWQVWMCQAAALETFAIFLNRYGRKRGAAASNALPALPKSEETALSLRNSGFDPSVTLPIQTKPVKGP